jgi:hypothetical protein
MKTKKILLVLIFAIIMNLSLISQICCAIQDMQIFPQLPSDNDSIGLVYAYMFPQLPCSLNYSDINVNYFQIFVFAKYNVGVATSPCNQTDTLQIGNLDIGNYELILTIQGTHCPDSIYCRDTLYFTVDTLSGFLNENFSERTLNVYPNPAHGEIYLEYPKDFLIAKIKLYAITGRLVKTFPKEEKQLNISSLPPGLYILYVEANGKKFREKIIIDNLKK